jgi:ribonuclease D
MNNLSTVSLPAPTIISSFLALKLLADRLAHESLIAVDTESNSLFAYYEQVCLIQLSTRSGDWLVDPLALDSVEPLAPLFANAKIEKVFHAAEYDLMCMKRDFAFIFANLFDTMLAARIVGMKSWGLGVLLEEHFGVQLDKRYQRADWSVRPMPADQLRYAQMDTHYLPALRDKLRGALLEQGALEEAREVFDQLAHVPPLNPHRLDPEGFWRINTGRDFPKRGYAVLRELYILREALAEAANRPPFKVMNDEALVNIALAQPKDVNDLFGIRALSPRLAKQNGPQIIQAVQRGLRAPTPSRPDPTPRAEMAVQLRYDALQSWRKQRAAQRGVESDVILPKEAMWALARRAPQTLEELEDIPGLGPWKRAQYGEELLHILSGLNNGVSSPSEAG